MPHVYAIKLKLSKPLKYPAIYIGITNDWKSRLLQHITNMKNHDTNRIYHFWRKCESFEFKVIYEGSLNDCANLETKLIKKFKTEMGGCLNVHEGGYHPQIPSSTSHQKRKYVPIPIRKQRRKLLKLLRKRYITLMMLERKHKENI